jgi:threonine dehydrogenase-like Zn-dependent dehydrogenase
MKAVVFHDVGDIRLEEVADPKIEEPTDAIVRLTRPRSAGPTFTSSAAHFRA